MKTLFVLPRTLGDVILGGTLVNEIKNKYPEAEITYVVEERYANIIKTHPAVKNVFIFKNYDEVLKEMNNGYDKIFVPFQTTQTDTIWHQTEKYGNGHLLDFYANRCEIEIVNRKLCVYPQPEDFKKVEELIAVPFVVMHTMSGVPSKNWSIINFNLLSEWCWKNLDCSVIQVGSETDAEINSDDTSGIDLRGRLSLNEIGALICRAKFFIGLDSGISYIAGAVNVPTICLMGSTCAKTSAPFGEKVHYIHSKKSCEPIPCHTNCRKNNPCINAIRIWEVTDLLEDLWQKYYS